MLRRCCSQESVRFGSFEVSWAVGGADIVRSLLSFDMAFGMVFASSLDCREAFYHPHWVEHNKVSTLEVSSLLNFALKGNVDSRARDEGLREHLERE